MTTKDNTRLSNNTINHLTTYNGGAPALTVEPESVRYGKKWVGDDDPLWRDKVAKGLDATNKLDVYFYQFEPVRSCKYQIKSNVSGVPFIDTVSGFPGGDLGIGGLDTTAIKNEIASVTNRAMLDLLVKINQHNNAFNGYSFVGEIVETARMFGNPMKSFRDLTTAYIENVAAQKRRLAKLAKPAKRIRNERKRKRALKKLAYQERSIAGSLWLQYRFGVLPLIGDLQSIGEAVLDKMHNLDSFVMITGKSKSDSLSTTSVATANPVRLNRTTQIHDDYVIKVKLIAKVARKVRGPEDSVRKIIQNTVTTDLKQLVPALWDLAPLSVFVDYFVPVNDLLVASMTDYSNVIYVQRQVRVIHRRKLEVSYVGRPQESPVNMVTPETGISIVSKIRYLREKWDIAIPTIFVTTPIGSPIRLTNLVAFLSTLK